MAGPASHAPPDVLPHDAADALQRALDGFSAKTQHKAFGYMDPRHVRALEVRADGIGAIVRGGSEYHVVWMRTPSGAWTARCTCPVTIQCKHAYAVAALALEEADRGEPEVPYRPRALAARLHPRTTPRSGSSGAPPPMRGERVNPATALLDRLRRAPDLWVRHQVLVGALQHGHVHQIGYGDRRIARAAQEADPELACWRLAQALRASGVGALPPALAPFGERPDLAARATERARAKLADDLVAWMRGRPASAAERRLRVELDLVEPIPGEPPSLRVLVRLTTPKLVDVTRTTMQLRQLAGDVQRDPRVLPAEQAIALGWLLDHGLGGSDHLGTAAGARLFPLLEALAGTPLARWADGVPPALAARGGVTPGAPLRVSRDGVRLGPALADRDGTPWVELRCRWPDGSTRSLDDVVVLPPTAAPPGFGYGPTSAAGGGLVLADGCVLRILAEPPAHLAEAFQEAQGFGLPRERRSELLGGLVAAFPEMRADVDAHTRHVPATAVVALDLRPDDWLQIRVFAAAGTNSWRPDTPLAAGERVFEHGPDGWRPASLDDEAPAPPADVASADESHWWLEAPDPEATDPALAWLAHLPAKPRASGQTGPSWPDATVGVWMHVARRGIDALADAWESRPPNVAFFGNEAFRRLIDGGRVTARVRVEATGVDWFAVSAAWEAEGLTLTDADLVTLRAATTRFVKLSSGWVRRDVIAAHDEAAAAIADLGVEPGSGPRRLSLWELAGARPEALATLERLGADPDTIAAVRTLRAKVAAFRGLPAVEPPPGLVATLRPYQRQGLDFLAHASALGVGAILADDMGLGKTLQALAWLLHLRAADPAGGPSLVVCPASVVHNWVREAERFAPSLRVLVLASGAARHALRRQVGEHDLVVTNYALLRRDAEAWHDVPLRALVLDEAQNVKNPDAAITRAALGVQARHRLALTGTPLENRALDLWSLMSVVNPGYLGSRKDFSARYDASDAPPHRRALLAARLRPVMLRRLKRQVAPDLPDRIEERRDCTLSPGQRRLYLAEVRRTRKLLERLSSEPDGLARHRIDVLAALTRLRQICCHPALGGGGPTVQSGKFEALFELLEPLLAEGHKVLVFSQFVRCLQLLAAAMRRAGIVHHLLTGETRNREAVVRAFTDDPAACVFLISLKAGGTGLNLTAASYVVLFDPWWNPAVEAQAIDRTHRIGQDRTVIAYRLLATGTVEERIWELQQRKAALVRDVLGDDGFARALTRDDLTYLFAADDDVTE